MTRQGNLTEFETPDLDVLTDAERDVYEEVRNGDYGPREYADETDRSPGTISNLLRRAERKLAGENSAEAAAPAGGN